MFFCTELYQEYSFVFCLLYCILLRIFSSIVLRLLFFIVLYCSVLYWIVLCCIVPCRTELYVFIFYFYHYETNYHLLTLLILYYIDTSILKLSYSSSYLRLFKWFILLSQISSLFFLRPSSFLFSFFCFSGVLRSLTVPSFHHYLICLYQINSNTYFL